MKPYLCSKCGEDNPIRFRRTYRSTCKSCEKDYYRRWYKTNGRKRAADYADVILLWKKEHPESCDASYKVSQAIKKGLLEKPSRCVVCGRDGRVGGHHKDYDLPYDVMWVCASCHKKIHLDLA